MRTWAGVLFRWTRLDATIAELAGKGVHFSGDPTDEGWGIAVRMVLPGGVEMLSYRPRHNTAI